MKLIYGDLFDQHHASAICITTNAFIKRNGRCVCGKGCASRAKDLWPSFDLELAKNITTVGNIPTHVLTTKHYDVLNYPVKPRSLICNQDKSNIVRHMQSRFKPGEVVPGWASIAQTDIIVRSARSLVNLANLMNYKKIVMPRPGCGAGELQWADVYPLIAPILDDRFEVITYSK